MDEFDDHRILVKQPADPGTSNYGILDKLDFNKDIDGPEYKQQKRGNSLQVNNFESFNTGCFCGTSFTTSGLIMSRQ